MPKQQSKDEGKYIDKLDHDAFYECVEVINDKEIGVVCQFCTMDDDVDPPMYCVCVSDSRLREESFTIYHLLEIAKDYFELTGKDPADWVF